MSKTKRANSAEKSSAETRVANSEERSFWQRHRIPVVLGVIAFLLYVGSILWMVFGSGQLVGT